MGAFEEISDKIAAAESGRGELLNAYIELWSGTLNIKKEQAEMLISRLKKISPDSLQSRSWIVSTDAMRYSLWPGTGNPFEKLMEAIELFRLNNDKQGEGFAHAMLALYYKNLGQLDKAQEAVNKAISNISENGPYLYFLGVAHFQGGEINHILKDYDAALSFLNKGLTYFEKDTGTFKGRLLNGIGTIYRDKNELELALDFFQRSLQHIGGKGNYMLESKNYADIGNYYFRKGDFEKSLYFQQKSLGIRKGLSQTTPLITNYIELAELYLKQNKLEEALDNALLAEKLAKEHNVIIKQYDAYLTISTIYEAMGKTSLALEYYKKYHQTKDMVLGQENARKLKQINMHHEMETMQKEKEIFKLRNVVLKEALDEIGASVRYAKRIQEAILPPVELIRSKFKDAFVLYKPKDVVAGDFYWMEEINDTILIAAADCTGHGVPGAMVSVVCSNALNRAVKEFQLSDTGKILDKVTDLVLETFQKSVTDVKDGMDISLLSINKKTKQIQWSGANNPLVYLGESGIKEITADKQPIGKSDHRKPFTTHIIVNKPGTMFYLFTDGYADQFGGPKGKKFMFKQLKEKLAGFMEKESTVQLDSLDKAIEEWKGNLEQVDDILIIGIKV